MTERAFPLADEFLCLAAQCEAQLAGRDRDCDGTFVTTAAATLLQLGGEDAIDLAARLVGEKHAGEDLGDLIGRLGDALRRAAGRLDGARRAA